MQTIRWMLGWGDGALPPAPTPEQLISRKHIAAAAAAATVQKHAPAEKSEKSEKSNSGPADWAYWNFLLTKTAPMNLREGDVKYNYFAADRGPERVPDWAVEQYAFEAELREIAAAFGLMLKTSPPARQMPEWVTDEFKEVAEYRKSIRRGRVKTSPLFVPMPPPARTYVDAVLCQ